MNKRVSNKYLEPSLNKIEWNLLTSLSFNSLKRGFLSLCFVIFSLRDVLFWRNASGSVRLECLCEEHSDEKKIFEIRSQNQMIFSKNAVLPEKSKLLEKIRHCQLLLLLDSQSLHYEMKEWSFFNVNCQSIFSKMNKWRAWNFCSKQ